MKTISVIGLGYVGLPSAAVFADSGLNVIGVDIDKEAVAKLTKEVTDNILSEVEKRLEENKKEIDWEQRRWELFKIFLSDVCLLQPRGTTDDALAKEASDRADRFIKLFKNI